MATAIAAYVIAGATSAGKTTLIERLVAARPRHERWAILVNDSGRARLTHGELAGAGEVVVREVAGCVCCTAQVGLRTALVALVRQEKPQRIWIEASAAAQPQALLEVLREPGIAVALRLAAVVTVVDAAQLRDPRYVDAGVYREQLAAADLVALAARAGDDRGSARAALAPLVAGAARIVDFERVDFALLDASR